MHNVSISVADSALFECRLRTLRFVVIQKFFLFKWDELRVTRVVQLFLHLRLNYYEAKIQMISGVFMETSSAAIPQNKN